MLSGKFDLKIKTMKFELQNNKPNAFLSNND